ncbi:MAG: ABC transporter ATP-binding protein [Gemmatimonadaceae bacterium]
MAVIEVSHLSYRYGRVDALRDVAFSVPEGALFALLGPNGSGKTTLLQILTGLRRARAGRVRVLGTDSVSLTIHQRQRISYIAEGQRLPGWMRLEQLEAYLRPLYPTWDEALASSLRDRFGLDRARKIRAMSRGEQMKAALLCALASRPKLLLMDEPFTGMDAMVKDDLVRGLLDCAGSEGWSVLLCSHDIGELELLADWVAFLDRGEMRLSASLDDVRARFKRVEVTLEGPAVDVSPRAGDEWLAVQQAGNRVSFVLDHRDDVPPEITLRGSFPRATRLDVRDATLRELFVALATRHRSERSAEMEVTT